MASIFTKIIQGELPCHKIAENEHCFAFMDIMPVNHGHTLVVPKKEVDNLFDLDEDTYNKLFKFSYHIAQAIQQAIPCNRVGVTVIGLEVPHAHVHLIPINEENDMNFQKQKMRVDDAILAQTAQKIIEKLKI